MVSVFQREQWEFRRWPETLPSLHHSCSVFKFLSLSPCPLLGHGKDHVSSLKSFWKWLLSCWDCPFLFPIPTPDPSSRLDVFPIPLLTSLLPITGGFRIARGIRPSFPLLFPQPSHFSRQTGLSTVNAGKSCTMLVLVFLVAVRPRLCPLFPLKMTLTPTSCRNTLHYGSWVD